MTKTIVITGVAGFLGSHLAAELLHIPQTTVIGLDNLSTGKMSNMEHLLQLDTFQFIKYDVADTRVLNIKALENIHEIYHLASPASPKFYQATPFATIDVNIQGTKNMLELAKRTGAKLLYTSTSETYGDPEVHPQSETYRGNVNTWGPRACYDEAKRMGEVFCYLYHSLYQVPVKVARIFNTYSAGLRNDDGRVISNFVTQALTGADISVYGDGTQTRSFCYVTDNIRGLILMMEKEVANGQIINIGNPIEYKIIDVAHLVKELTHSQSKVTFHPLPEDDPKQRRPDINKAKQLLGWEPQITLEQGLQLTIASYKQKLSIS
ncbi:GDP-mannose 4,6-dehydratase [Ectobacillus antri]|uniref:UDP-glucuronate decarboxylase n=1 Tax=Ectobacillus antri TaxID=2486280 RepID=A0ABT6H6E3_9BACI|nr:GDP-mannose 4,6-dehydratase [Ectobacillus antri]MDG4656621.1 GDP-mannose 4,6-dehydratase [Ectobacillus antri]MDG5754016.1 GDP-mannose 4,6-dehydratase [Ectobacillus antri]